MEHALSKKSTRNRILLKQARLREHAAKVEIRMTGISEGSLTIHVLLQYEPEQTRNNDGRAVSMLRLQMLK